MKKTLSALLSFIMVTLFLLSPFFADAQIVPSIPYNLTNGSLADATQVMGNFNTIVTDTNANAAHNGANTDITSLTGLTTPLANTYGGTIIYTGGTTGGSANAQTIATTVPSNFSLTIGNIVTAVAGFTNTASMTLAVNGGAATQVAVQTPLGLASAGAKAVVLGQGEVFYYDGTYLELINSPPANISPSQLALQSNNTFLGNASGSDAAPTALTLASTLAVLKPVITVDTQKFTTTGTYTPCANLLYADVKILGGGGGGGGVNTTATATAAGGGAGGLSCAIESFALVSNNPTITIGTGGTAGVNTGGTGGTGVTSSFGSLLLASGGVGGTGGTTASNGSNIPGGVGGAGNCYGVTTQGAYGGFANIQGNGNGNVAGAGGNTFLGGAGQGISQSGANTPGNAGLANSGSGGGGAWGNGTGEIGGAGGSGVAIITEYCY